MGNKERRMLDYVHMRERETERKGLDIYKERRDARFLSLSLF
jgi:hypothetical protein